MKKTGKGARTSNDAERVTLLVDQLECPGSTALQQQAAEKDVERGIN